MNPSPSTSAARSGPPPWTAASSASRTPAMLVVPVAPHVNASPNRKIAELNEPSRKYLIAPAGRHEVRDEDGDGDEDAGEERRDRAQVGGRHDAEPSTGVSSLDDSSPPGLPGRSANSRAATIATTMPSPIATSTGSTVMA